MAKTPKFVTYFPTVTAAFKGVDQKKADYDARGYFRWINAGEDVVGQYVLAGEVTKTEAKNLREYINDFVKAAFAQIIRRQYLDLPRDGNNNRIGEDDDVVTLCYYNTPDEARLLPGYINKLAKAKSKSPIIADAKKLANELLPLAEIVEWSKGVTYNAADRKTTVRAQKVEEARNKLVTDKVYLAVLPLKKAAEDEAEERLRADIATGIEILKAANFDLHVVAPVPRSTFTKDSDLKVRKAVARLHFFESFTTYTDAPVYSGSKKPAPVVIDEDKIVRLIERAREDAAASFEAYAFKLNDKINDEVLDATLNAIEGISIWSQSLLVVTTRNKGKQVWHTQRILNCSSLGNLFHQWPTRLKK